MLLLRLLLKRIDVVEEICERIILRQVRKEPNYWTRLLLLVIKSRMLVSVRVENMTTMSHRYSQIHLTDVEIHCHQLRMVVETVDSIAHCRSWDREHLDLLSVHTKDEDLFAAAVDKLLLPLRGR